jgi:hypothetical protein
MSIEVSLEESVSWVADPVYSLQYFRELLEIPCRQINLEFGAFAVLFNLIHIRM